MLYSYTVLDCTRFGEMGSTLMGPLAKVMNLTDCGKHVRHDTFGKIKVG